MMTIIIIAIIAIGISITNNYRSGYADFMDYFLLGFLSAIMSCFISIPLAFILPMDTYKETTKIEIESIADGSEISGQFFLGSGSFEGTMKYTFYFKEGDYFKLKQIDHNDAKIKYSEADPYVLVIKDELTNSFINWFGIDVLYTEYIINIPKGSIKNNYILDSQ